MSDPRTQSVAMQQGRKKTVGRHLRTRLFDVLGPILEHCEQVSDSNVRLLLQAGCLDIVSALEEVIEHERLDEQSAEQTH
ncbi:MAG: hypothetical protein KDD55_07130 [Bdellovibrionales bacterium]|nr:hypothetical protein [Bdellovibrionales bacterium]